MKINDHKAVECPYCGDEFVVYEYVGMEGAWYSDHVCEAERAAILADVKPTLIEELSNGNEKRNDQEDGPEKRLEG